jgi:hypothetical protein
MADVVATLKDLNFEDIVSKASQLPGVRIDRAQFLEQHFRRHGYAENDLERIIHLGPPGAGVSTEIIDKAASGVIAYETTKVTALSAASGIPGGLAMLGTIPADLVNFYAHVLRVVQKLAYLYGWPDMQGEDAEGFDDGTRNALILFLGTTSGVKAATDTIQRIAQSAAQTALRRLPQQALTKGVIYPIVKNVARIMGTKMTKDIFAKGVSKAIPVVGAATSGGLTLVTFRMQSNRLKKQLSATPFISGGSASSQDQDAAEAEQFIDVDDIEYQDEDAASASKESESQG